MSDVLDPRITPARADLAARHLQGRVQAERFVDGSLRQVVRPTAALTFTPAADARQESQLLFGERFTVYDEADGWAWGQGELDGYVGYLPADALSPADEGPTHVIAVLKSHLYPGPDLKLRAGPALSLGSRVQVVERAGGFARIGEAGWLYARHLTPLDQLEADYVATGMRYLGVPYLWGGRSADGIDCSGFVQVVLQRAGFAAPRDSDMQQDGLGEPVEPITDFSRVRHGDLVTFPGHCGFYVEDWKFLHANAFDMAVSVHDFSDVLERAHANAGIGVTGIRRLTPGAGDGSEA